MEIARGRKLHLLEKSILPTGTCYAQLSAHEPHVPQTSPPCVAQKPGQALMKGAQQMRKGQSASLKRDASRDRDRWAANTPGVLLARFLGTETPGWSHEDFTLAE
ncbi:predicted protein [Chaetomium globosum CBS 148.51]|uniref:Uncharacterized protein n=1 Tax=Chaetomium globosum (strain ATCC 6205 / CBS 148.51 / DSM 1962 / NBRC 6347 / NRRL 1970) TaxID=306901 RepID=Q2GYT5_CHAGB|nr:uncharacterized protein CHGG_06869 [Chaetomium globosum CBS 148.51]EAQ85616.1 predicted protein [Chaetomium globosum CBS 148.51]